MNTWIKEELPARLLQWKQKSGVSLPRSWQTWAMAVALGTAGVLQWQLVRRYWYGYRLQTKTRLRQADGVERPVPHLPASCFQRWTVGHIQQLLASPSIVHFYRAILERYGQVVLKLELMGMPSLMVADPKALHYIYTKQSYQFHKPDMFKLPFELISGQHNLLILDGDEHKMHRKVVNPVFNMKSLKETVPVLTSSINQLIDVLDTSNGNVVEFQGLSTALVLNIIGRLALGIDFEALDEGGHKHPMTIAYDTMLQDIGFTPWNALCNAMPLLRHLPVPHNFRRRSARRLIYQRVRNVLREQVAARQAADRDGDESRLDPSLIQSLLRENQGREIPLEDIPDELVTFVLAGHETTSNALTMMMYCLGQDQACQEKLYQSLQELPEEPSTEDFLHATYLNNVISEGLRYFSPAYLIERAPASDQEIPLSDGNTLLVPKGLMITVPLQAIHHDPKVWGPDALEFHPERWDTIQLVGQAPNPKATRTIETYQYVPFSGGPRSCIGRQLALMELRMFVHALVQRYRIRPGSTTPPELQYTITAKAKALPLRFVRRD